MRTRQCRVGIGVFVFAIWWTCSNTFAEEWAPAPGLNVPREFFDAAVDESGNIWALGGWNRTGGCSSGTGPVLDSVEVLRFDGISYAPQWELTPIVIPTSRRSHSVVITGGFIYVLGGHEELGEQLPVLQVDRYDILSDTWNSSTVPPLNPPRSNGEAITDPLGRIWYIGGYPVSDNVGVARVDIFDPAQPGLGWRQGPSLNHERGRFGCVLDLEGRIYAIGGYNAPDEEQTVERIDPCEWADASSTTQWVTLPESLPGATSVDDEAVLGADGIIYVVGGWVPHHHTGRVLRLDPVSGIWEETTSPLAQARNEHREVLGRDDHIYAIGGNVSGCNSTASVERLYTGPRIFSDCNSNGINDEGDMNCGTSADDNGNGIPDECENQPPVCDVVDPNPVECEGATTMIALGGTASSDPDGDPLTFLWTTDCPGAIFDNDTSETPILAVDTVSGCGVNCNVTLAVDDGNGGTDSCATTVTIADTQAPVVTCSVTPVGHPDNDDDDDGRLLISYSAFDQCGVVTGSAVIETPCCPVPVSDGQIIELECADHPECELELDFEDGVFEIESDAALLIVTATDECGNTATCEVDLCIPDDDGHDDDE